MPERAIWLYVFCSINSLTIICSTRISKIWLVALLFNFTVVYLRLQNMFSSQQTSVPVMSSLCHCFLIFIAFYGYEDKTSTTITKYCTDLTLLPWGWCISRPLGYKRVCLPLYHLADTLFNIQWGEVLPYRLWRWPNQGGFGPTFSNRDPK